MITLLKNISLKDIDRLICKSRLKRLLPYLIFFILTFSVYSQTLFFGYTNLDDNVLSAQSDVFSNFKNIGAIFSTDVFFSSNKLYFRPILNLSYMIDTQIGGSSPYIYHLGNIILHFLAGCLIYIFLKKIIKNNFLAFWLSLLFLVHPALAQAVAWIPGRNDSLLTIFVLAAFLSLINFFRNPRPAPFLAYLGFLFLSLLTKETALFLPVLVVIFWLTIGKKDKLSAENKWLIIFGSISVSFIWFLIRQLALSGGKHIAIAAILKACPSAIITAFKISSQAIWPFNQSVLTVSADFPLIYSLIIWPLLATAIVLSRRRKNEYLLFGLAWFIIFFVIPFFFSADAYFSHRLYLPIIGLLIVFSEIDWIKKLNWQNKKTIGGLILIVLFFSIFALNYSNNFRDVLTFSQVAVKNSPHSSFAHAGLGVAYLDRNNFPMAIKEFQESLNLDPSASLVHYNLGLAYFREQKLEKAEKEWRQELEINHNYYKALIGLGNLYYQKGNREEAANYWKAAIQTNQKGY